MSSSYREGNNRAKAVRAGIVELRPNLTRSKKDRPIVVESRPLPGSFAFGMRRGRDWFKWGQYRAAREAEQAIANLARKYGGLWEFRVRPEGSA
jgi:hypothetical protein